MPSVRFLPDDITVDAQLGDTFLKIAAKNGVKMTSVCGGRARCSTCRLIIEDGVDECQPLGELEKAMADRLNFGADVRLACQATVEGDVTVRRLVLDDEDIELTSQISDTAFGSIGTERHVAILFADLRGSTPFAEALPPYDVIHVMNKYFLRMGRVIDANGGYIESYRGDGLMALFGSEGEEDAPFDAVKAAVEMLQEVDRLNPSLEALHGKAFEVVIGVHYGNVVLGSVGFGDMRQMSAVGDAVNLAARIEDVNKDVGATLLISSETWENVEGRVELGRTFTKQLKGKTGDYTMYEILGINA